MFGMGPCRGSQRFGEIPGRGREGERTHLRTSGASVPTRKWKRGFGCGQGHHDSYAWRKEGRFAEAVDEENGSTTCDPPIFSARGPMGRAEEHQPSSPEAARHPVERDAGVLLQIQRSAVRQGGEARHYGAVGIREQRRCTFKRIEGVRDIKAPFGCTTNWPSRYASEVDVDFVRKSIKAIGQTAVKIDTAAERCVNVLLDLINTRVSYVVQEAVVVMKVCLLLVAAS